MVDAKLAQAQIRRLGALRGWKDLPDDGKRELLETLTRVATTDYHAKGIVDRWLETQQWLPAPAELRSMAEETPTEPPRWSEKQSCSLCGGRGRESYWAVVTAHRWPNGEIRNREIQRIPATQGRENLYLVERPAEEAQVDGERQRVAMISGFCCCEYGRHLRGITARGEAA